MLEATTEKEALAERVLFVDDSRLMRYAGERFLADDYDVVVAEHGRDAWRRLQQDESIGLVFTDLMMPVMDGMELLKRIRSSSNERTRHLPVLVVTSNEEARARDNAMAAGATSYINKPFSAEDLREALQIYLEGRGEPAATDFVPAEHELLGEDELLNRLPEPDYFYLRLAEALSFHRRQNMEIAVLHCRFPQYHRLSGRYGQSWANAVMRNLHRHLRHQMRAEDSIHRTAQDMFSIILMATTEDGTRVLSQRLNERLTEVEMHFATRSLSIRPRYAIQTPDVNQPGRPEEILAAARHLFTAASA